MMYVCLSDKVSNAKRPVSSSRLAADAVAADDDYTCPSASHLFKSNLDFAHHVRSPLKNMVQQLCPKSFHQYVVNFLLKHCIAQYSA